MFFKTKNNGNFNLNQVRSFHAEESEDGTAYIVLKFDANHAFELNGEDAKKFLNYVVSTPLTTLTKPVVS